MYILWDYLFGQAADMKMGKDPVVWALGSIELCAEIFFVALIINIS